MRCKPRNFLAATLVLLALGAAAVHQSHVDAAQRRQQALNDALYDAIIFRRTASVRDLLHRGADPNCRQQPASFLEKIENVFPSIWRLSHKGEEPDLYLTPLGLAVLNPSPEIVRALLADGADPNQKDSYGQSPRDIDGNGEDDIYVMLKAAEEKRKKPLP